MKAEENVLLAPLTTLRAGGPARYFFIARTVDEVKKAADFARTRNLQLFILGGGSNVLFSDNGFDGVVIKMEIDGVEFKELSNGNMRVIAGAGVDWDGFVAKTVEKRMYGLENLSLIPGTVGAAPVQNIGAYGAEVKDTIEWVEVFDVKKGKIRKLSNKECEFAYRNSIFKKENGKKHIITRVSFLLDTNGKPNIVYKDLREYFQEKKPSVPEDVRNAVLDVRKNKFPGIQDAGTAGSFFKNPIVNEETAETLRRKFDIPEYPYGDGMVKLSAAWLLDRVGGFKGMRSGNVSAYEKQPLVIVNYGKENASEIFEFAQTIKKNIKQKTNIDLEFEVNLIGHFTER